MASAALEQAIKLVDQLSAAERTALIAYARSTLPTLESPPLTREMLLAGHQALLAAGAFENVESLRNKYARPDLDLSFEALQAILHEAATEWEQEPDEFFGEN